MLPFTVEQFFAVFVDYNRSVWPAQWLLRGIAAGVLILCVYRSSWRDRAICLLIASLWTWTAVAYHLLHFATINRTAYLFAAFFLGQAALFAWWAISDRSLELRLRPDFRSFVGIAVLVYALIGYPLLSTRLGHSYPASPTFGVPCPTTIFTLGILTLARASRTSILFAIPLLWSLVGGSAAFLLGVWQDLGLVASGALVIGLFVLDRRRADF